MQKEILIVEDDPGIREMEDMTLTEEGFRVFSTDNGLSAIEFLEKKRQRRRRLTRYDPLYQRCRPPHAILMDYKLRYGIDGVQTARRIKSLGPQEVKIPIVFVTAISEEILKKEVPDIHTLGSILLKPFDLDTLILKADQVTRRRI